MSSGWTALQQSEQPVVALLLPSKVKPSRHNSLEVPIVERVSTSVYWRCSCPPYQVSKAKPCTCGGLILTAFVQLKIALVLPALSYIHLDRQAE